MRRQEKMKLLLVEDDIRLGACRTLIGNHMAYLNVFDFNSLFLKKKLLGGKGSKRFFKISNILE